MKLFDELEQIKEAKTKVQIFLSPSYSFVGIIMDVENDYVVCIEDGKKENNQVIIPIYKIQYVRIR